MANLATLEPNVFTSENQPLGTGRKPGQRNRATILATYLQCRVDRNHPVTGEQVNVTVEEAIHLELIKLAIQCKRPETQLNAIKEIFDTMYGKHVERIEGDILLTEMSVDERRDALARVFMDQMRQISGKSSVESELNGVERSDDAIEAEFEDVPPVEPSE